MIKREEKKGKAVSKDPQRILIDKLYNELKELLKKATPYMGAEARKRHFRDFGIISDKSLNEIRIMFYGYGKVGKSTLLNSICGHNICSVGITNETAILSIVKNVPGIKVPACYEVKLESPNPDYPNYVEIVKSNENPNAIGSNITEYMMKKNEFLRKFLKEMKDKKNPKETKVEDEKANNLLKEKAGNILRESCLITELEFLQINGCEMENNSNLLLLDTPGKNEYLLSDYYGEFLSTVTSFSDIIVYVANFLTGFDEKSMNEIRDLLINIFKNSEEKSKDIILVINKFDKIPGREKAKETWDKTIFNIINAIPTKYKKKISAKDIMKKICYVSAKDLYFAKQLKLLQNDHNDTSHDEEFLKSELKRSGLAYIESEDNETIEGVIREYYESSNINNFNKLIMSSSKNILMVRRKEFVDCASKFCESMIEFTNQYFYTGNKQKKS